MVELAAGAAGARQQQQQQGPGEAAPDNGLGTLRHMLDVSTLKYQVGGRAVAAVDLCVLARLRHRVCTGNSWTGAGTDTQRICVIYAAE